MKKSSLRTFIAATFLAAQQVLANYHPGDNVKIANWNLQIFGTKKAANKELMRLYANTLKKYDVVFIQEIRDSSNTAFPRLCSLMPDYLSRVSSRAGRSNSKEQYGILYKKGIVLNGVRDYNPDSKNRWERPPIDASFGIGNYILNIINIHTKPTDVKREMNALESIASNPGNVIVIGDLNADCKYYNRSKNNHFSSWCWKIRDNEDTTSGNTDCAYDRIILNPNSCKEYVRHGIITGGIGKGVSDHYPVWVEMIPKDR